MQFAVPFSTVSSGRISCSSTLGEHCGIIFTDGPLVPILLNVSYLLIVFEISFQTVIPLWAKKCVSV